ncbi:MAG: cyanoexosortase A [Cyanobacteria bacterium RI_101]|nr:cyanoexosortase A [Cyanobacteria bacterium RI_101]
MTRFLQTSFTPLLRLATDENRWRPFWFGCLGAGLVAIHLTLCLRQNDPDFLGLSLIVWFAVITLLRRRGDNFAWASEPLASGAGSLLVAVFLLRSFNSALNPGLTILPLLGGLGLALLAGGSRAPKTYGKELVILSLLVIPKELGHGIFNLSQPLSLLTAKLSGFLLWYFGAEVTVVGNALNFPAGAVVVSEACSGVSNLTYLLKVAVIFLLLFPFPQKFYAWVIPPFALALALVMNVLRIALLALLSPANPDSFLYWHEGEGSTLFSLINMLIFGTVYFALWGQVAAPREVKPKRKLASTRKLASLRPPSSRN